MHRCQFVWYTSALHLHRLARSVCAVPCSQPGYEVFYLLACVLPAAIALSNSCQANNLLQDCIYLPCRNVHVGRQYILHKFVFPIAQRHQGQQCPHVQMHYLDNANVYLIITGYVHLQTAAKQMHSHQLQTTS